MLSANMLALLNAQYGNETANSLFYASLQSWAEMRGLDGAAGFLKKQAEDERGHADMILEYIHDRNEQLGAFQIDFTPPVVPDYSGLFTLAQYRERTTSEQIYAIKSQAESEGDFMSCAWLMQPSGLVLEQVEEERIIQTILDRIASRGSDTASVHDIDVWIAGLK